MNTFEIYSLNYSKVFDRICHSPPSAEDISLILNVLKKYKFNSLGYRIDVVCGNNHKKVTGLFYNIDEFFQYLESLCKEGITYGVVVYLN